MTYKQLCDENKYLFGQLENLTLLIGHAIVTKDNKSHSYYLEATADLKTRINRNLDLMEQIWNNHESTFYNKKI